MKSFQRHALSLACATALGGAALSAHATLVINDTLTGAASSYPWVAKNGACLTAGNNTGTIPACVGLGYYSGKTLVGGVTGRLPDTVGNGALRLTNGDVTVSNNGDNQTGAVVSNFTFPTNEGIQVSWTSVTYGGDNLNNTGADGITFYLFDGAKSVTGDPLTTAPTIGGLGGSLGYSCSNVNGTYDGVAGGYLGVGVDEYGNFSNPGDNTDDGPGYHPGRISVRGAGDTNYLDLNASAAYGKYYPLSNGASTRADAIHKTCKDGYAYNYSGVDQVDSTGATISNGGKTHDRLPYNYRMLRNTDGTMAYVDQPTAYPISNQQAINLAYRNGPLNDGIGTAPGYTDIAKPITYALKITSAGVLDFSYSYNGGANVPVVTGLSITATNGPLPSSFRFGFSSGTGGGNNVHEITCFKATPADESNSSAGSNVQQSARVETGSQVYLAYYHPTNWWGQLTAQGLSYDSATDMVTVNTAANWDAHCVLTGATDCSSMSNGTSTTHPITAQASSARTILSYSGTTGIPFQWSNLTSSQKSTLTAGDATSNSDRLNFLRGDRTKEVANGGSYRNRSSVLGAIIDSSPTWVGPPASPYDGLVADKLFSSATVSEGGATYTTFKTTYATRENVVYVGADDGLMHGFRTGAFNSVGDFDTTTYPNDGREVLAYVPNQSVNTIHSTSGTLDFSAAQYAHNFFVDGTPGSGDLYYNGAWHTWLVGGMGPGGQAGGAIDTNAATGVGALFALDVTNPTNFSESNASSLVIGEWNSATITCVTTPTACGPNLGMVYGTPMIRRLHNGNWGVIFGNGIDSANGHAGIFIMEVNITSGARTFRYIDTGSGANGTGVARNGIVQVTPADLDGDHITDYVYAGDLYGNVWRFDLTSNSAASWSVRSTPLFTTGTGQPITTKVIVGAVPTAANSNNKVMFAFGTGQKQPVTLTSAEIYASGTQYLYGVWDWDMAAWNAKTSPVKYDSAASTSYVSSTATSISPSAALTQQSVTSTQPGSGKVSGYRTVSQTPVCWFNSTVCTGGTSGNPMFGWRLPLPSSNEQVVYNPVLAYDMFIVNSTIPTTTQPLTCATTPAGGYTMAVTMAAGAAPSASFFANASGQFVDYGGQIVAGIGVSGTGTPSFVVGGQKVFMVTQTEGGTAFPAPVNPTGGTGGRLNWTKVR
jgi:type IV pilus assembly protein PilY1